MHTFLVFFLFLHIDICCGYLLEVPGQGICFQGETEKKLSQNYFLIITKTCLPVYNFDPLKPHFYLVKLGFTGYTFFFLIFAWKDRLWVLLRTTLLRQFQRVPTIYVLSRNSKTYQNFLFENFQFLEVKFSVYLNRRVFIRYSLQVPRGCASNEYYNLCFHGETRKLSILFG